MIESCPEIMLMMRAGMKNGEILRGPPFSSVVVRLLDHRQAADARADDRRRCVGALASVTSRPESFSACTAGRDAEMDEAVHAARLLRREVLRDVEVLHLAGDLAGERLGSKRRDARDAGLAGENVRPGFGNAVADRADDS